MLPGVDAGFVGVVDFGDVEEFAAGGVLEVKPGADNVFDAPLLGEVFGVGAFEGDRGAVFVSVGCDRLFAIEEMRVSVLEEVEEPLLIAVGVLGELAHFLTASGEEAAGVFGAEGVVFVGVDFSGFTGGCGELGAFGVKLDGDASAFSEREGEGIAGRNEGLLDGEGVGVFAEVRFGGVLIDDGMELLILREKIEGKSEGAGFFVVDATYKPILAVATGGDDVVADFGGEDLGLVPFAHWNIADELSGRLVVIGLVEVGGHDERAVNDYHEAELLGASAEALVGGVGTIEERGGVVHGAA